MKAKLMQLWRVVVGSEVGFVGEGCYQWYYTLYLVMAIMLAWRNYPDIAVDFTLVCAAEYIGVCTFGYFMLIDRGIPYAISYLIFLAITSIVRLLLCWQLELISAAIGIIGILIAPNESGQSFVFHFPEEQIWRALIPNTFYFALFVYITVILPVDVGTKAIIILGAMLIHPVIDLSEGACMSYVDNFMDCFEDLIEANDERKDRKYQKQKSTNNHDAPQ